MQVHELRLLPKVSVVFRFWLIKFVLNDPNHKITANTKKELQWRQKANAENRVLGSSGLFQEGLPTLLYPIGLIRVSNPDPPRTKS